MSDVSQGEGWWSVRWPVVSASGLPQRRSRIALAGTFPEVPPAATVRTNYQTERSAVAVATARKCVNGHQMPESHVFCSVCGSGRSEDHQDFSAPGKPMDPIGRWASQHIAIVVATVIIVVVGVVGGIGIAASGGSSSSGSSSSNNSSSTNNPYSSAENQFLSDLNNAPAPMTGDFANASVGTMVNEGNAACGDLVDGNTIYETLTDADNAAAELNLTEDDMAYLVGRAVITICPQYEGQVQAYLSANGYSS